MTDAPACPMCGEPEHGCFHHAIEDCVDILRHVLATERARAEKAEARADAIAEKLRMTEQKCEGLSAHCKSLEGDLQNVSRRNAALETHVERLRLAAINADYVLSTIGHSPEGCASTARIILQQGLATTPEVSLADRDRRLPVGLSLEDVDLGG